MPTSTPPTRWPLPYFDTQREFIEYLKYSLIPDLQDARGPPLWEVAQDFEEAIYWMTRNWDTYAQKWGARGPPDYLQAFSGRKPKRSKAKRKVKQSPKQQLLTKMTAAKWNKYKKGRGKKTYVEIRAEVSRSQAFKKKAKRL